jgi:hypothetical protein
MPRRGRVSSRAHTGAGAQPRTVYRRVLPIAMLEQNAVEKHMRQRTGYRAEASVRKVVPGQMSQCTAS